MIEQTITTRPVPRKAVHAFVREVARSISPGDQVLDIGAGHDHRQYLRHVVRRRPHLVGCDPDDVHDNPRLDEAYQCRLEELGPEHSGRYDAAFSVFVLEHVARPDEFMAACARTLRPGGHLFGLTPNLLHYFGISTWVLNRVGLADRTLVRLKGEQRAHHDHVHFPLQYRMNTVRTLTRLLDDAGFREVAFTCFEWPDGSGSYLPRGTRWVAPLYSRAVYAGRAPRFMGYLSFRARR